MFYRTLRDSSVKGFVLLSATAIALVAQLEHAQGQIAGQAVVGKPFGVGRVEIQVDRQMQPEPLGLNGLGITAKNGRVLYPTVDHRALSPLIQELLSQLPLRGGPVRDLARGFLRGFLLEPPRRAEIYFLFTGDEPLDVTVQDRQQTTLRLVPESDSALYDRLLRRWWEAYTAPAGLFTNKASSPPLVENYLQAMLARRMDLPLRETSGSTVQDQIARQLGMALGTESARLALERETMLQPSMAPETADQPLPKPFEVPALELPEVSEEAKQKEVKTDVLAARVPEECFYVRFGNFTNFLWAQDMLATWGGDLQNLWALRGLDHQNRKRFEDMLVVRSSILAKLLGDTVVADVAILGTDLYLEDGAACGLLFYAKSNALLAGTLQAQRVERVQKQDGATDEKVKIEGRDVSYLSTPDGSVRSYYVSDGNYHLVTSSRTLVRRFLETASGKGSLGQSAEFRYARTVMPQSREDTIFLYLSDAFFRNLVSPQYQIELARRVRSRADIELVQLASLAAAAEGKPGDTLQQLSEGGFLPAQFGRHADGSQTVRKDGEVYDTLRGRRGRFTPIPDMEIKGVAPAEVEAYQRLAEMYKTDWKRLDPVILGLKRQAMPDRREHITIDARLTPVNKANYDRLQRYVGAPSDRQLTPIQDDFISLDLVRPSSRLFGGLRDLGVPFDLSGGELLPEGRLRNVLVGYIGTTGNDLLGIMDRRFNRPDAQGMAVTPLGIWRREVGPFKIYSFQPELLMQVGSRLQFEPAKTVGQLRLRVADPTRSGVPPLLNKVGYVRTRQTAMGNLRFLHELGQQFHVPGPDCQAAAELLLGAKLICPFGGRYVYRKTDSGTAYWTSTFLESEAAKQAAVPPGFVTPPLNWFRGMSLDASLDPNVLAVHADLEMQLPEHGAK